MLFLNAVAHHEYISSFQRDGLKVNQVLPNYEEIIISSLAFTLEIKAEHTPSTYITVKGRTFQDKENEDVTIANTRCRPLCYDKSLRNHWLRVA